MHDSLGRAPGRTVLSMPMLGPGVGVPAAGEGECDKRQSDGHAGVAGMAEVEVDRPGTVHAGAPPENFQPPAVQHEVDKARVAGPMETLPLEFNRRMGTHLAGGLEDVTDRIPGGAKVARRDGPGPLDVLSCVKVILS